MKPHPVLVQTAALFAARGSTLYLVGGAVRDMLRGKTPHDWDLATDAPPETVSAVFTEARPRGTVIPTGIRHGTVTVLYCGHTLEITTFRTEAAYSDGRRPDSVQYAPTIEADLSRRDFTMNAVALRLPSFEQTDPFNGAADIAAGIIRCVGSPAERFAEDGLRPLRAVRFAAQLGFTLHESALHAIPAALDTSAKVSPERVHDELEKILAAPQPSRALRLMEQTGLLQLFLPELATCRGVEQKGFHHFDVLDHSLHACDYAASHEYDMEVRLAALLHDIGKPLTRALDETGVWTFYRHEQESALLARTILERLRYPNAVTETVCHLIREHMFHYTPDWSDAAVRRFIVRAGEPHLRSLYCLRHADSFACAAVDPGPGPHLELARRVEQIIAARAALSLKDLAVSGDDLAAAGIPPGRTMGLILRELLETVLDDPEANTQERLLTIARNRYALATRGALNK